MMKIRENSTKVGGKPLDKLILKTFSTYSLIYRATHQKKMSSRSYKSIGRAGMTTHSQLRKLQRSLGKNGVYDHKNKAQAMKVLKARLYMLEQKKRDDEVAQIHGDKGDIAWGNQIRSYVMQPYQMVKDHRTNHQTGNVQAVLDGDINAFIESYLRHRAKLSASKGK